MLSSTTVKQAAEERSNRRMKIAHDLNSSVKRTDAIIFKRDSGKIRVWQLRDTSQREITFQVAEACKWPIEGGSLWTDNILGLVQAIGEVCSQVETFQLVDAPRVRIN